MSEAKEGHNLVVWEVTNTQVQTVPADEEGPALKALAFALECAGKSYAVVVSGLEESALFDFLGALTTASYSLANRMGAEIVSSTHADSHEEAQELIKEKTAEIVAAEKKLN